MQSLPSIAHFQKDIFKESLRPTLDKRCDHIQNIELINLDVRHVH